MAELISGQRRPDWTPETFAAFVALATRALAGDKRAERDCADFISRNGAPEFEEIAAYGAMLALEPRP